MSKETSKKIVDEISKCFTCSSLCPGKDRVYIFGKTSHNFIEITKSTLNRDVNCYANDTNTRLFVCKTSCVYFFSRLKKLELVLIFQQTHCTYSAHVSTCQFQSKQDTKLEKGCKYFFEGVCYNFSMYRYTLDVSNCQNEPW